MAEQVRPVNTSLVHTLRLPRGSERGQHPLLVLLHGRGADEHDLLPLADHLDGRLLVVSFRAPLPFPNGGAAWYHIHHVGAPEEGSLVRSLDLLRRSLREVVEGYPVDARHVYLLGFSQGAVMSFAAALSHPELVTGVVALSGYVPTGPEVTIQRERARSVEFFVGHGVYDEIIPIEHGRAAQRFLTDLGAEVVYREYPMGHQISLDELEDVAAWLAHRLDRGG